MIKKNFKVSHYGALRVLQMLCDRKVHGKYVSHRRARNSKKLFGHRRGTLVLSDWDVSDYDNGGYWITLTFSKFSSSNSFMNHYADFGKLMRVLQKSSNQQQSLT